MKSFPIRTLVIYQQRYFDAICAIEGESSSSFDEHTELTENVDVDAKDVELHQLLAQSFFKLWNQHIWSESTAVDEIDPSDGSSVGKTCLSTHVFMSWEVKV